VIGGVARLSLRCPCQSQVARRTKPSGEFGWLLREAPASPDCVSVTPVTTFSRDPPSQVGGDLVQLGVLLLRNEAEQVECTI